jgi:hypothetical protein
MVDGEMQTLEISSCQWQAGTLLEIKNPTIKYSDGYLHPFLFSFFYFKLPFDIWEIYVYLSPFWKCYEIANHS